MSYLNHACGAMMIAAASFAAAPAVAADLTADLATPMTAEPILPIDIAFGVKLASEYNLRSVSQTKGKPAIQGYAELSAFDWVYAGVWASNVGFGGTNPSAEIDIYGGLRHSFDKLSLDVGYVWIDYTGEDSGVRELDFYKVYGIAKYALTDEFTIGANLFWTGKFINVKGIDGTHASVFGKYTLASLPQVPVLGAYVSGEFGKQWISDNFAPEYTFWNVGGGFTYKAATLDLRYTDSGLSKRECALFIGQRGSCGSRFLASLSFDTSLSKLK
ncbi:TorF family putative porin [Methylopila musalis]|uniref:TorF family putative porin n=1 Tax=Methylopila musalis TaxID=1134781 RepID=A0ABW3Z5B6_9HYPH